MLDHHQRALDKAVARLRLIPDVRAILLGGSIAKKCERPDSDVDLIVVLTNEGHAARGKERAFLWHDVADYPKGYVEGRYISRSFLFEAAERGSEPTRHSFIGVTAVWSADEDIVAVLPRIPVYPVAEKHSRMTSFVAQMMLNRWYFWHEGVRMGDPYLKLRAATDIVLFGARAILAFNERLFPCQKRLMESLAACPQKPEGIVDQARALLVSLDTEKMESYCKSVVELTGMPKEDLLSVFLEDVEMAWFSRSIAVAEW